MVTSPTPPLDPGDVLRGMHETHRRMGATIGAAREAASYAIGLAELLIGKGVVGLEELDRARGQAETRLAGAYEQAGLSVALADVDDKYSMDQGVVEIDCESRLPLCRAACCRLRFALSEQDIHEGVVQWELTEPYLNRQGADGSCVHRDAEHRTCTVYDQRPAVCRSYDCRDDARIWVDFEARIVNPEVVCGTGPVGSPVALGVTRHSSAPA